MDSVQLIEQEFVLPLKEAITRDDLIATRQMIDSIEINDESIVNKTIIKVTAEKYIEYLRDGEQYKEGVPTINALGNWIIAKDLDLNPYAVQRNIIKNGTSWDQIGGSVELKAVLNEDFAKYTMDKLIENERTNILNQWL
jgi:hypothetical protein